MRINFQNNTYQYKYNSLQSFKSSFVTNNTNNIVDISYANPQHSHLTDFKEKCVKLAHKIFRNHYEVLQCERIEGSPLRSFSELESPIVEDAKTILNKKTQFGVEEYKGLTPKEREVLDKASEIPYFKNASRTIESDFEQIDKVASGFIKLLNKKYPDGYSVLAVGSSPSVISEIFELKGIDVKTIPYSRGLARDSYSYIKRNKKKYFDTVGLDSKYVADSKKIIVMDYYVSGLSLQSFKKLLRLNFGRDQYSAKFDTRTLNYLLDGLSNVTNEFKDTFEKIYWNYAYMGSYSYVPKLRNDYMVKKFINGRLEFKPSVTAKLMHYLLYKKYL